MCAGGTVVGGIESVGWWWESVWFRVGVLGVRSILGVSCVFVVWGRVLCGWFVLGCLRWWFG